VAGQGKRLTRQQTAAAARRLLDCGGPRAGNLKQNTVPSQQEKHETADSLLHTCTVQMWTCEGLPCNPGPTNE
jgi:hypothetical protein